MDSFPQRGDTTAPEGPDNQFHHLLRGLAMGAADAVPGVSGGTVALILGIYERLLASIGHVARAGLALVRGKTEQARAQFRSVEWRLVIPLGIGIATALAIASATVPHLLESYPSQSRALFLGLVMASVAIPWRRVQEHSSRTLGAAVAAGLVAFLATGIPPGTVSDPSSIQIFLAAAVAICAMILPGVSGSYLLLVLGMYDTTLRAVRNLDVGYVLVFATGAAIGLGAFSILLNRLLRTHHDLTMAALVGLMVGSLRALWPWQDAERGLELPASSGGLATALGLVLVGFLVVRLLERSTSTSPHGSTPSLRD